MERLVFGLFKRKTPALGVAEDGAMREWLAHEGFDMEDFRFSIYQDPSLMSDESTSVVVGFGRTGGTSEGFVMELSQGTVIEARTIHRGAASYHKKMASQALYGGSKLVHELMNKSMEMRFG